MLIAVVVSSIIVSSAAIMLSLAGRSPSLTVILLSIFILAATLFTLRDLIARAIFSLLFKTKLSELESIEQDPILREYEIFNNDEDNIGLFLVWSLLDRARQAILPWTEKLILVVHEEGVPHSSYPEADDVIIDDTLMEDIESRIQAVQVTDHIIELWIPTREYNILRSLIESSGSEEYLGEAAIVLNYEGLKTLYEILKKIYLAVNLDASNELVAYNAYKAIQRLQHLGVIRIPQGLLAQLAFEERDTWLRVKAQLEEEEALSKAPEDGKS